LIYFKILTHSSLAMKLRSSVFLEITSCVVESVLMTADVWVSSRNQWMTLFRSYFCHAFVSC